MTVLELDGSPICGGADSTVALRAHWGLAFSDVAGISSAAAERFFQHIQPYIDEVHRLSFDEFAAIALHVNRSSPGPDGVPYQACL